MRAKIKNQTLDWFSTAFSEKDQNTFTKNQKLPSNFCNTKKNCKSTCCKKTQSLWMYDQLNEMQKGVIYLEFGEAKYCMMKEYCEDDQEMNGGMSETFIITIVALIVVCFICSISAYFLCKVIKPNEDEEEQAKMNQIGHTPGGPYPGMYQQAPPGYYPHGYPPQGDYQYGQPQEGAPINFHHPMDPNVKANHSELVMTNQPEWGTRNMP